MLLEKHLPVASGIGGGSADAAAALRILCRLWKLAPGPDELAALALRLGADVPVCLASAPARMSGVGETVQTLAALPPCGLLLVNPGIAVATADVFRVRSGDYSAPVAPRRSWDSAAEFAQTLSALGNDLEPAALTIAPQIGAVLSAIRCLPACLLARMSGSGATCFGLFPTSDNAQAAAAMLPAEWWRSAGPLYEPSPSALFTDTGRWGVAKR